MTGKPRPLSQARSRQGVKRGKQFQIGRLKPAPLYEQVKAEITERIGNGTWPKGVVLPKEADLSEMLGVALGTVRRALADLATEGLIARRPRTGTIVTGRAPHFRLDMLYRYFRLHGPNDTLHTSQVQLLTRDLDHPNQREVEALKLSPEERVHRIMRIRRVEGKPVMWERITIPSAVAPELHQLGHLPETLSSYLRDQHAVRISASREKLFAELSTDLDREYLERSGAFAVLVIEAIAFDRLGEAVLYSHHRAFTESFSYINEIN